MGKQQFVFISNISDTAEWVAGVKQLSSFRAFFEAFNNMNIRHEKKSIFKKSAGKQHSCLSSLLLFFFLQTQKWDEQREEGTFPGKI